MSSKQISNANLVDDDNDDNRRKRRRTTDDAESSNDTNVGQSNISLVSAGSVTSAAAQTDPTITTSTTFNTSASSSSTSILNSSSAAADSRSTIAATSSNTATLSNSNVDDARRRIDDAKLQRDKAEEALKKAEKRRDDLEASRRAKDPTFRQQDLDDAKNEFTRAEAWHHERVRAVEKLESQTTIVASTAVVVPNLTDVAIDKILATIIVPDQPPKPTNPLWWRLGEKYLNNNSKLWAAQQHPHALIGLTGSGKTRTLYEMLCESFGFLWICDTNRNGGTSALQSAIDQLDQRAVTEGDVSAAVCRLLVVSSLALIAWRRKNTQGKPIDWLNFQNDQTSSNSLFGTIVGKLATFVIDDSVAQSTLQMAVDSVRSRLLLVIDEAQVLTKFGAFESTSEAGVKRPVLHPFCRKTNQYSIWLTWWISGTSLSLKDASKIGSSVALKPVSSSVEFVCKLPNAFDKFDAFQLFVNEYVGVKLDDDLMKSLHERFRGRARPVAMLADAIKSKHAQTADVVQIADEFEAYALDSNEPLSLTAAFLSRLTDKAHPLRVAAHVVADLVSSLLTTDSVRVRAGGDVELFNSGVTPLDQTDGQYVICEPLVLKAMLIALSIYDPDNAQRSNPHFRALDVMAQLQHAPSALGFMAESALAGYIHNYIEHNIVNSFVNNAALNGYPEPTLATNPARPFLRPVTCAADCVVDGSKLCSPPLNAHPDTIHSFRYGAFVFGALGQIKFTQLSLEKADWEHAVRSTSKSALFRIDADSNQRIIAGCEDERTALINAIDNAWKGRYFSYVFTLAEPPPNTKYSSMVGDASDRRPLFVFSPELCPTLLPDEIWQFLKSLKKLLPSSVYFNKAKVEHLLPISNMTRERAETILKFRDEYKGSKTLQWDDITRRFTSLKGRKQPDWLLFG